MRPQVIVSVAALSIAALLTACTGQGSTGSPQTSPSSNQTTSSSSPEPTPSAEPSDTTQTTKPTLPTANSTNVEVPPGSLATLTICLGSDNKKRSATLFEVVMIDDKYLPEDESAYRSWTRKDLYVKNTNKTVPITWSTNGLKFYFDGAWSEYEVEADPGSYKFFIWKDKDTNSGPATEIFNAGPLLPGENGPILVRGIEAAKMCL